MKLSGGRFVRVFQWIAPVVMPFLVFFGHGFLGAPMGWMMFVGIIYGPLVLLAMYVPPIITVFDLDAKAMRSTRVFYDLSSWVLWGAMLLMMLTIVDGGDVPPWESVLSTWGLMSSDFSSTAFLVAVFIALVGLLGAAITAIIGVVVSRRNQGPMPS